MICSLLNCGNASPTHICSNALTSDGVMTGRYFSISRIERIWVCATARTSVNFSSWNIVPSPSNSHRAFNSGRLWSNAITGAIPKSLPLTSFERYCGDHPMREANWVCLPPVRYLIISMSLLFILLRVFTDYSTVWVQDFHPSQRGLTAQGIGGLRCAVGRLV